MEKNKKEVLEVLKRRRRTLKGMIEFDTDYLERKKIELESIEMCIKQMEE